MSSSANLARSEEKWPTGGVRALDSLHRLRDGEGEAFIRSVYGHGARARMLLGGASLDDVALLPEV